MGRHVEHRGGCINVISINKEVLCVASPGFDDIINISNTDHEYNDRSFKISDCLVTPDWKDWTSYLESDEIKEMILYFQKLTGVVEAHNSMGIVY
jgi:galactokinase